MSISFYDASIPVFTQYLQALSAILKKAAAHAEARKYDPTVLCQARLFPDMFSLARQVQLTCDFAKNGASRLAGQEPPRFSDDETTFAELEGRITRTLLLLRELPAAAINGPADRPITMPVGKETRTLTAQQYLLHFILPNFFFHAATVYDILRANGVELVKKDYMGVT